ncbi:MAG: recombinase family protein [Acidobacteria bacterium]|nr:recombinase family protein [Acidobacteriota bacterium]
MGETQAAIYARVACATPQKKPGIVSQLEALRNHAAGRGMRIIEEFTDEGHSGLQLDRPGLDRMRSLAERRGFDVLLTRGPDRLARSFALGVLIIEELARYGVRIIFLDSGTADGRLSELREITGAVAGFEQAKAAETDRSGRRPWAAARWFLARCLSVMHGS